MTPMPAEDLPELEEPPEGEEGEVITEPRIRPNLDVLAADITMRIFTRNPAAGSSSEWNGRT